MSHLVNPFLKKILKNFIPGKNQAGKKAQTEGVDVCLQPSRAGSRHPRDQQQHKHNSQSHTIPNQYVQS
jgi:hypothetical protein